MESDITQLILLMNPKIIINNSFKKQLSYSDRGLMGMSGRTSSMDRNLDLGEPSFMQPPEPWLLRRNEKLYFCFATAYVVSNIFPCLNG